MLAAARAGLPALHGVPTRLTRHTSSLLQRSPASRRQQLWCRALATGASAPPMQMLFDSECALCMREVSMLRKRNTAGAIDFVDIAAPDYRPELHNGISYEQAMAQIHVILPAGADGQPGRVVTNVAAFRHLYEAVGLGWVYAITKVEAIRRPADWLYGVWAKYRLQITGRDPEAVFAAKRTCREASGK